MVEVNITSNGVKSVISSRTIREIMENMTDIISISDISGVAKMKNMMLFDCKLDNITFKFSYFDGTTYEEFDVGQEYYQILYEDINGYIHSLLEEMEDELKILYNVDDIKLHHEIYDLNETFSDVKFVIAVTFKKMSMVQLKDITAMMAKRQVLGSSKYFN